MLSRQILTRNTTPCLVRCLSRNARGVISAAAKKALEKTKANTKNIPNEIPTVQPRKFLPLSALPQLPEELRPQEKPKGVDFSIPKKYLKTSIPAEVSKSDRKITMEIVKNADRFAKEQKDETLKQLASEIQKYVEFDPTRGPSISEHPLKRTLSGIGKLNPGFDNIKDEYLWELFPRGKTFGVPPFQQDSAFGFKEWEEELIKQREKEEPEIQAAKKNLEEYRKEYLASGESFYIVKGGRKKVNKKLLKKYIELKRKGTTKLRHDDDYDNENLID
ncbi:hypothetical protein SBY92_001014 [Candida maltosa Xu316]|uniref:Uncharacterized protein n=1 Tax=Candida maltosa (strain Xu316) TaxID=1245528 RepID=M3HDN6_CANMX|nr:hypothetical protein G210_4468 [Candida maltosa Xu316]